MTNLGVIGEARIGFDDSMHVVTGETGAGKTLIVEALGLIAGGRADASMVGPDGAAATVEAAFSGAVLPEWLGETGDELVISRTVSAEGKNRAYVNGRLATISQLQAATERLLVIHGQHSALRLIHPREQLRTVDSFGGRALVAARDAYDEAYEAWKTAHALLESLAGDPHERAREVDLLRYQVEELAAASLEIGEDEKLEEEAAILESAAELREIAEVARSAAADAADRLSDATAASGLADRELAALAERATALAIEARDISSEFRARGELISEDPERLTMVRARIDLVNALRRKYGPSLADVIAFDAKVRSRLAHLESFDDDLDAASAAEAAAIDDLATRAATLSSMRAEAATEFEAAVSSILPDLALPGGAFRVEVVTADDTDPARFSPSGADSATFYFSANPSIAPRPLSKVASGGELSRVMLAIELVAIADDGPETVVFDEVDAGVGGAAAVSVGEKLATLGDDRQVLCVTHLAQVASRAERQVRVKKSKAGAEVALLGPRDRVVEISRMLAGEHESKHAQDHAEELLRGAESERRRRRKSGKKHRDAGRSGSQVGQKGRASIGSRG